MLGVIIAAMLRKWDTSAEEPTGAGEMFTARAPTGASLRLFFASAAIGVLQLLPLAPSRFRMMLAAGGFFIIVYAAKPFRFSNGLKLPPQMIGAFLVTLLLLLRIPILPKTLEGDSNLPGPAPSNNGLVSGAILRPEKPPHVTLILPVRAQRPILPRKPGVTQFSIEFSGEYWIFPYMVRRAPPKSAMIERATPTAFNFTAVDRTALMMQARQKLTAAVDPRCCTAVEIDLRNEDKQPDTISVQVVLAANKSRESLGTQVMPATASSHMSFPIPPSPQIAEFDEIDVQFHLAPQRIFRSANVAIDRFVFVRRD